MAYTHFAVGGVVQYHDLGTGMVAPSADPAVCDCGGGKRQESFARCGRTFAKISRKREKKLKFLQKIFKNPLHFPGKRDIILSLCAFLHGVSKNSPLRCSA